MAAVVRFLPKKSSCPTREKKKEKKHETQKKISATPTKFLVVWQFFTHSHSRTKSSETEFEPRTHRIRFDSFREKKGNNTVLLKKAVLQSNNTFEEKKRAEEIYNTHTHKRVLYHHHLRREKSARKEVHGQKRKRE